jgi:flagellar hook-associated protein 3 FlgL
MLDIQEQMSSGKRINSYSDDPGGAAILEKYKSSMTDANQYKRNIEDGIVWIQQTEAALDRLEENLIRAKSLAVQGANSSNGSDERRYIGEEVNQILEDALSVANTNFRGKYVFAGLHTQTRPFIESRNTQGEAVSFGFGDDTSGQIFRSVDENVDIQINMPGNSVFNLKDGPIIALMNLRDALYTNNIDDINESLDELDIAMDRSLSARSTLGARMSRMQTTNYYQESVQVDYASLVSEIEDADYAELTIRLATSEAGYRAAISTTARIVQTSLVDLLT